MSDHGNIEGKTFLITGASSGLGAAYIEPFLKEGAKSVTILDINEEAGNEVANKANLLYPGKVWFVKCDISSEESIEAAFNEVIAKVGTLDVIINNAGLLNDSPQMWRKSCDVNFTGLVSLTFKGRKHMRTNEGGKGGTIINVASEMAILKYPFLPVYAGTKAAVLHFSQSISRDPSYELTGVRILTMCFGATSTALFDDVTTRACDEYLGKIIGQNSTPENLAKCQKPESGAKCMVEIFKRGENGSVWLSYKDKPAIDITSDVNDSLNNIAQKYGLGV